MPLRGRHIRRFAGCVALGAVAICGVAGSQADGASPRHDVVELFTSQGCSKCPPADRLIADFARRPGTIALSFPVNYWDYIGWKDTLASPAFSARQKAYAAARGDRQIFTPQAIVDGVGVEAGSDREAILKDLGIRPRPGTAPPVSLELTEGNGTLHVTVGGAGAAPTGDVGIYVLRVARTKTVEIDRGENSGHRFTYTNVVRAMSRVGAWTGALAQFDIVELKGDDEGYVVLLQAGTLEKPGAIFAAEKTSNL